MKRNRGKWKGRQLPRVESRTPWATSVLPLTHDSRTTTNPHTPYRPLAAQANVSWVRLLAPAGLFTFLYFHLIIHLLDTLFVCLFVVVVVVVVVVVIAVVSRQFYCSKKGMVDLKCYKHLECIVKTKAKRKTTCLLRNKISTLLRWSHTVTHPLLPHSDSFTRWVSDVKSPVAVDHSMNCSNCTKRGRNGRSKDAKTRRLVCPIHSSPHHFSKSATRKRRVGCVRMEEQEWIVDSSFFLPLTLFFRLSLPLTPSSFLSLPLSLPSSQVSHPPLITCPPSAPTACGQPLPGTLHQHNQSHGNAMGSGGAGRHRRRTSLYFLPQTTGCEWE